MSRVFFRRRDSPRTYRTESASTLIEMNGIETQGGPRQASPPHRHTRDSDTSPHTPRDLATDGYRRVVSFFLLVLVFPRLRQNPSRRRQNAQSNLRQASLGIDRSNDTRALRAPACDPNSQKSQSPCGLRESAPPPTQIHQCPPDAE